jgi:hypothetical protein
MGPWVNWTLTVVVPYSKPVTQSLVTVVLQTGSTVSLKLQFKVIDAACATSAVINCARSARPIRAMLPNLLTSVCCVFIVDGSLD